MQVTAKSQLDVMLWVETTPHHIITKEEEDGFVILKGHNKDKLRIPKHIFGKCFLKAGDYFDKRMYRWDHDAHKEAVKKENLPVDNVLTIV